MKLIYMATTLGLIGNVVGVPQAQEIFQSGELKQTEMGVQYILITESE